MTAIGKMSFPQLSWFLKVSQFQNVLMKNQFGQNTNENISVLEVYYFKVTTKQSLSSCKQNIDSLFVLTLK